MRALLILIAVTNLGFFAWTLSPYAQSDRDPGRASREVHPQAIIITPLQGAATGSAEALCLESGPYPPTEIGLAEVAVSSVALPGTWAKLGSARAGQWVVYLGPFADKETMARKEQEVKRTGVPFEAITERGELDLGFLLGRFTQLSEANAALDSLSRQAPLRTARVVNLVPPTTDYMLRIEAASGAIGQRLQSLKGGVLKPFEVCTK